MRKSRDTASAELARDDELLSDASRLLGEIDAACMQARYLHGLLTSCIGDGALVVAALAQDYRNRMA